MQSSELLCWKFLGLDIISNYRRLKHKYTESYKLRICTVVRASVEESSIYLLYTTTPAVKYTDQPQH